MVTSIHGGYQHELEDGCTATVRATEPGRILLALDSAEGDGFQTMMTPDQALRLAVDLLREQNLERFGNG